MNVLIQFLNSLEERSIYYRLNKVRDSIMVEIAIPGERWEAEFFPDGHIEVEKFVSDGTLFDEREFEQLLRGE